MKFVPKPLRETADSSRPRVSARSVLSVMFQAAILLGAIYVVLGFLAEIAARTVPDSWERRLASFSLEGLADSEELVRPQAILDRLIEGRPVRDLEYRLFLLEQDEPNAVALLGGHIGVTSGLLALVESEEGLAFVLAHELGHHQERHGLRRLGRGLLFGIFLTLFLGQEGMTELQTALRVAESSYSRSQETAADRFALRLVHERYEDTTSAFELFERLLERRADPVWQKYLGSHPLTEERLERLRRLQSDLATPAPAP